MCLIETRKSTPTKDSYYEQHHIIPKSEGGSDDERNLVSLTAREHYIAHLLLAKIYDDYAMHSAVMFMQTRRHKGRDFKFNSHLYEKLRRAFSAAMKGRVSPMKGRHHSEETKAKLHAANKGKHHSEETRKKMSKACKGKHCSEETKNKLRIACKGFKHSEEARKKISESHKGIKFTIEHRKKIGEKHRGKYVSNEMRKKMSESLKGKPAWNKGKKMSAEACAKMSKAHKGKTTWIKGKHLSEETKQKISAAKTGKPTSRKGKKTGHHWYNNGTISILAKSCPEGFVKGRLPMPLFHVNEVSIYDDDAISI